MTPVKSSQVPNPHESKSSQSSSNFTCACGVLWCCSSGFSASGVCWKQFRMLLKEVLFVGGREPRKESAVKCALCSVRFNKKRKEREKEWAKADEGIIFFGKSELGVLRARSGNSNETRSRYGDSQLSALSAQSLQPARRFSALIPRSPSIPCRTSRRLPQVPFRFKLASHSASAVAPACQVTGAAEHQVVRATLKHRVGLDGTLEKN